MKTVITIWWDDLYVEFILVEADKNRFVKQWKYGDKENYWLYLGEL